MDRVNGANFVDIGGGRRGFRSQNAAAGVPGTEVTDAWMNGVQEELLYVIQQAGLVPDAVDWTQLWQALQIGREESVAPLTPLGAQQTKAFTASQALADAPTGVAQVVQSVAITGTRYIDAFAAVAWQNGNSSSSSDCLAWLRLSGGIKEEYIGCRPPPAAVAVSQVAVSTRRVFQGLNPATTYSLELAVEKVQAVSPIRIFDPLIVAYHE